MVAEQIDDPADEGGLQKGDVAGRKIGGVGLAGEGGEARSKTLQGAAIFLLVANDGNVARQRRHLLPGRRHDEHRFHHLAQQSHDCAAA